MESEPSQPLQLLKKIQNYIFNLTHKIGEGSFSKVYRGTHTPSGKMVAVKKIRVGEVKSKIAKRLLECQVAILRQVRHPSIISCLDIHFSINNCYIVSELCEGGNLYDHLRSNSPLPLRTIHKILLSLLQALSYLSLLGIIHRDVKVSNIFLKGHLFLLGDFGFAIKAKSKFRDVTIGSPLYMSPEGLIHNIYGPKTDVWAFGILIYELFHRTTPLEHCKSEEELRKKVIEEPPITADMPNDLKELMLGCLRPLQAERMSIKDIQNSGYISRVRGELLVQPKEQKQLTVTNHSSSNTLSTKTYIP